MICYIIIHKIQQNSVITTGEKNPFQGGEAAEWVQQVFYTPDGRF